MGGVIRLEALFAGPICGASMNPARSLAPAVVAAEFRTLWVYLLAPPLGAALAVSLARLVFAFRGCRAEDERWQVRKDGQHFWALGIVTPAHDASGNHTASLMADSLLELPAMRA